MGAVKVDRGYLKALNVARHEIRELLAREKCTPLLIRLAFNDALTFDKATNTAGVNASIRTKKELEHPGNEHLDIAVKLLAVVKIKVPEITYADLYQLAGIVAVEAAGGPQVGFTPGRKDSWTFPPPGRLPNVVASTDKVAHLKGLANRLGISVRHMVALLGVHPIARWWPDTEPPYFSTCYHGNPKMDNSYFVRLVRGDIKKDAWMLTDSELRMFVQDYAKSESTFFQDYAVAHEELSRLGTKLAISIRGERKGSPVFAGSDSWSTSMEAAVNPALLALQVSAVLRVDMTCTAPTVTCQLQDLSRKNFHPPHAAVVTGAIVIAVLVIGGQWWRRRRRLLQG